ncbi:MAG: hypothetical protein RJQ09_19480 [Cyclobacteriaceae bacterium]
MKTQLLSILLLISYSVLAQQRDHLIWKSTLTDESREEYVENFGFIKNGGYQLNQEELVRGRVIVSFSDLNPLIKGIPGGSDGLQFSFTNQGGAATELFLNRNTIRAQLKTELERNIDSMLVKIRVRNIEDFRKKKRKEFDLVLKGKKSTKSWSKYIWTVSLGNAQVNTMKPYSLSFVCKKVPYATLDFDSLYSGLMTELPQLDNEKCLPLDRYTYFKKYLGQEYEGITYRPYRPRSGIPRKKNFRIFFDKAKSNYHRDEIDDIVKYLNDSNLVIETAKVLAFASVEGDSAINMKLQRDRARVLMNTLEQANNDSIEISIETREDWGQFESQLRRTPFSGKYTHEEWKALFENDSIEDRFTKYLTQQRRAELFLTLTERLSPEGKITVAKGDFYRMARSYNPEVRGELRFQKVRRLYAIKKYMELASTIDYAPAEEICGLIPPSNNEYHIIQLYETAKSFTKGDTLICDNYEDIILSAHYAVMDLINRHGENRLYLRQALDVQSFTYGMIELGEVDASILCEIDYPDEPHFYDLILNRLYFLDNQGINAFHGLPCGQSYLDDGVVLRRFFASRKTEISSPPTADSRYYFVLKKIVLSNDERIKEYVSRSDYILQFDIAEFLRISIQNWNVLDGVLFDPEVTPEVMKEQLRRLLQMSSTICPNQVSWLALNFHLKVLHQAIVSNKKDDLADEAMAYIADYYGKYADRMTPKLAMAIAKQLMAVMPVYHKNEPAEEAYNVLRLKDWKEPLKGEALNYYFNLVQMVSPDREVRLEGMKAKYPQEVWDGFYTGRYSVEKD